ncbi:hypothetical protein MMC30_002386 [Trapelia coarctata]|nr:hypothetical protein [Trapelia coarctata]
MPSKLSFTFRVLDVFRGCVVEAPIKCRYLALSYVWGGIDQLRLTKQTFPVLTKGNSTLDNFHTATKTVKDAIAFCQVLGETYLWIDALCILQDDPQDQKAQISAMDLIYSCAFATVVAASGKTANAGLPGVLAESRPSSPSEIVDGLDLMLTPRYSIFSISESPWNARAWTYQEKLLSKRLIIFTNYQAYFYCNNALWREDNVVEDNALRLEHMEHLRLQPESLQASTHFDSQLSLRAFSAYQGALQSYSTRKLTKDEDVLNAFTGVETILSPALNGFRWGLPNCCFEAAMTWRSKGFFPIARRTNFPSWSWAGWKDYTSPIIFKCNSAHVFNNDLRYQLGFSYGYGAEITWYQLQDDESLCMISNEKPHEFSPSALHNTVRE